MKPWLRNGLLLTVVLVAVLAWRLQTPPANQLEAAFAAEVRPGLDPTKATLLVFGDPKT